MLKTINKRWQYVSCYAVLKVFSLLLLLHPRRMDVGLLVASDAMMCLAYSQSTLALLAILLSRLHDPNHDLSASQDIKPHDPSQLKPTAGTTTDATEAMMISTV